MFDISFLVLNEAPPLARPTVISMAIITAVPARAALEDVRLDALLGDDPVAVVGPDAPAAGVELVPAAVALAAVVAALTLLQDVGDRVLGLWSSLRDGGGADVLGQLELSEFFGCVGET